MALLPDGMADADSRTIFSDGKPTDEDIEAAQHSRKRPPRQPA